MAGVDYETEQATRKILRYWYGSIAQDWNITESMVIVVAQIVDNTAKCSGLFKFVPTPSGAMTGVGVMGSMAFNYAKDAVNRASTDNSYYNTCVKRQALSNRSDVEAASSGAF